MFLGKNCLNCYFCSKCFRSPDDWREQPFSLSNQERKNAKLKNFNSIKSATSPYYLQCWKGQWSEAMNFDIDKIHKHKCIFFYSYKKGEGKFFPAIEKELEFKKSSKAAVIAQWSFFFSSISLLISLVINIDKVQSFIQSLLY